MKKTVSITLFLFMLLMLVSCGGLSTRFSIHVKDVVSGERLSVKMHVKRSNVSSPSQRFSVSMSPEELSTAITKADPSLSAAVYQDKFVVVQTESGFFLLMPIEKLDEDEADETRYAFFAPVAQFQIDSPKDTYAYMYVPYHLIRGIEVQTDLGYPDQYARTFECDACGTVDDFINFYSFLEQCEVEESGGGSIVVTSKENGYQIRLSFCRDNGQMKVTFTVL